MALTKIIDIIEPSVFTQYQKEYTPEKYDLLNSSIISPLPAEVASQLTAGGSVIDMPFWQDTDRTEPDILSDDETVSSTPKRIAASKEKARKLYLGKSWSQADLAGVLATGSAKDPLKLIGDYVSNYWRYMALVALIKSLDGVLADNVANDSSDMLATVYSDTATPVAANKISSAALTTARLTMGEMLDGVGTIVMHSKVFGDALNQEAISYIQPSKYPFMIAKFAGMDVLISNACTTVAGTNATKYRSYILGAGAIAWGEHFPEYATETWRDPGKGNGAGLTTLYTRRHRIIHPKGFQFTSSVVAGRSPNWSELQNASNWDRKMQRNNIRIAFLESN